MAMQQNNNDPLWSIDIEMSKLSSSRASSYKKGSRKKSSLLQGGLHRKLSQGRLRRESDSSAEHSGRRSHDRGGSIRIQNPTISQRRKSEARTLHWLERFNPFPSSDIVDDEPDFGGHISDAELFERLDKENSKLKPGGTIRLPSDALYRRKSRFDTEDLQLDVVNIPQRVGGREDGSHYAPRERAASEEGEETIQGCAKVGAALRDAYHDATILKATLSRVQGRFGTAIMEYFAFVKWLIMLNFFITLLTLPIILPQLMLPPYSFNESVLQTTPNVGSVNATLVSRGRDKSLQCTSEYQNALKHDQKTKVEIWWHLVDFIQGGGFLENSTLFYGFYFNKLYQNDMNQNTTIQNTYDMASAFIAVPLAVLVVSIIAMLWSLSDHVGSSIQGNNSQQHAKFSCSVLAAWDFGLADFKAVKLKRSLIRQELVELVANFARRKENQNRTNRQIAALVIVRVVINLIVVITLVLCGVALYYVQDISSEELAKDNLDGSLVLLFEYLPTSVITLMYLIIPLFFYFIVKFERYKPKIEISVTMVRILSLRMLSLGFLLFVVLYQLIFKCSKGSGVQEGECRRSCQNHNSTTTFHYCWENYIGQQIYKLVVLDFVVLLAVTCLLEYPRQLIISKLGPRVKLFELIGQQEFDMPKNVMDVLYNQTLCWIGVFFSPFIPAMICLKMFLFFWVKKASLFANQKPSATLSKSSDVYSFFLVVMLLSLLLAYIIIAICVQIVEPSYGCGPFRIHLTENWTMINSLDLLLKDQVVIEGIDIYSKTGDYSLVIFIGIIVILGCMLYYYITLSNGLSAKIKLMVDQLALKMVDKRKFMHIHGQDSVEDANNSRQGCSRPNSSSVAGAARGDRNANFAGAPNTSHTDSPTQHSSQNASMQSTEKSSQSHRVRPASILQHSHPGEIVAGVSVHREGAEAALRPAAATFVDGHMAPSDNSSASSSLRSTPLYTDMTSNTISPYLDDVLRENDGSGNRNGARHMSQRETQYENQAYEPDEDEQFVMYKPKSNINRGVAIPRDD